MTFAAIDESVLDDLSDAYAFFGNSLLAPMTQTSTLGLETSFWRAFPDFGSTTVAQALELCATKASEIARAYGEDASHRTAVEFTTLFLGPTGPKAAPWESFYVEGVENPVGFGAPALEMRALLREDGLEVSNRNNQYPDHIGIELLYLSSLCARTAKADRTLRVCEPKGWRSAQGSETQALYARTLEFLDGRILAWMPRFEKRIAHADPNGYYRALATLTLAVVRQHARLLRSIVRAS